MSKDILKPILKNTDSTSSLPEAASLEEITKRNTIENSSSLTRRESISPTPTNQNTTAHKKSENPEATTEIDFSPRAIKPISTKSALTQLLQNSSSNQR